ncbi:hypothetical protein CAPTEDRAFT_186705 [Capitella teleta]|uniref:Retrotransposon gag domain-containing protein n=1 Tax=Capitella teleta TaxID=283909 RepID=R7TX17_CAPTE|nr:hypothetical protein CAPTEDRAFT_186705 [Capitella teleta]|eukprot:ELT95981.1 hypothetical protein CAPTEDRAFT_186705 [Capitella teleta]
MAGNWIQTMSPFDCDSDRSTVARWENVLKGKLNTHFRPLRDTARCVFLFHEEVEKATETTDQYCTRLQAMTNHYRFGDNGTEIRAQILQKTTNKSLQREILKHPNWTLNDVLQKACLLEAHKAQACDIKKANDRKTGPWNSQQDDKTVEVQGKLFKRKTRTIKETKSKVYRKFSVPQMWRRMDSERLPLAEQGPKLALLTVERCRGCRCRWIS